MITLPVYPTDCESGEITVFKTPPTVKETLPLESKVKESRLIGVFIKY